MDVEDVKLKLAGYRPELYADDDPQIAEALAVVKADPELSEWLDEQIAFDREFAAELTGLMPRDQARQILLSRPVQEKPRRPRFAVWSLAAAAVFLLCSIGGVKYFLFPPPVEFTSTETKNSSTFRRDMAMFATQRFVLDKSFKNLEDSKRWLEENGHPAFDQMPSQLVLYKGLGCKTIDWGGTKVGLICFKNSHNETVHLFVVDKADLGESLPTESGLAQIAVKHGLETGGWDTDEKLLLLVGGSPGVQIGELL